MVKEPGKELMGYQGAVVPMPLDEVERLGGYLAKSKYFTDVTDTAQAVVKIIAGQALGFDPVYSMSKLYIVKGTVAVMAEAVAAMIKRSMRYDYKVLLYTEKECSLEFSDSGKAAMVSSFTLEDAKRARLIKEGGAWHSWPRAMLFSKALLQGARIVCPHIIAGVRTVEELGGYVDESGELQIDPEQAEKDTKELWPPYLQEGEEPAPITVESVAAEEHTAREEKESVGPIDETHPDSELGFDPDWLIDSLREVHWTEGTTKSWLANVYKVDTKGTVVEVVARLSRENREAFFKVVQTMLGKNQPRHSG